MKKYIIPFTLVFTTSLFVWNTQRVDTNEETLQTENSDRSIAELEEANPAQINDSADSATVSRIKPSEKLNNITNSQVVQTQPSQAPPSRPRIIEVIDEVNVSTNESVIEPAKNNANLDSRISLIETKTKYPLMIVEETGTNFNQKNEEVLSTTAHIATHFMIQVKQSINLVDFETKLNSLGCKLGSKISKDCFLVEIMDEPTIESHYAKRDAVEAMDTFVGNVEPDYWVYAINTPNDPRMIDLWGLQNNGQTGGVVDKDIDAPEAWDQQTGSKDVLVGVVDTGVDRSHQDLSANMWENPNEIAGNGIDDDSNGFVDDVYGWDFYDDDNNPDDGGSHGTHCAGTIGAVGNNGVGITGVCWKVNMVGIRFLGPWGGSTSDAIKSIEYATKIGVDLTSNSWGGGGYSQSLKNAIDEAGLQGIGFVAAAGNGSYDNDSSPSYPASYSSDNIIAVGAHDHQGNMASFSQWGNTSVDLFAPGVNILSTVPGNAYSSYNGTSMATPHVSGAYALLLASNPNWTVVEAKNALMESVDLEDALDGKCVTGGRLNIFKASSTEPPSEKLIALDPESLDFGTVVRNNEVSLDFSIINQGNEPLTVTGFGSDSLSFNEGSLMGHWTFDGNTDDSSDNQNHGNLISGEFVADRDGNGMSALQLNGSTDYVHVSDSESLNASDQFSVSMWLKIDSFSNTWSPVFHKGASNVMSGGKDRHYAFWLKNNGIGCLLSAGNNNVQKAHNVSIPVGEWFHYGMSLNRVDQIANIYLNGENVVKQADPYSNFNTFDGDFYVGSNPYADQYSWLSNFKGTIDDLRLYNVALKQWEVEFLYDTEKFLQINGEITEKSQNQMGHWTFDGNTDDSSDNQNHGNLISGEFVADRDGNGMSALQLNGSTDYVHVSDSESLNASDQFSVSMWLKIDSFSNTWSPVFHKGANNIMSGGKDRHYAFWLKNNGIGCLLSAGNNNVQKAHNVSIPVGEWFHYGMSLNRVDRMANIYLNGFNVVKQADPYSNFNTFDGDFYIGSNPYAGQYSWLSNFKGTIDDLRLYNVALGSYDYEQIINGTTVSSNSPFVVSIDLPAVIEPGSGLKGTVTFSSDAEGVYEDSVIFSSDAGNDPELEFEMRAEVQTTPQLVVDPDSMHFGLLAGESKSQPLTLSNLGDGNLDFQAYVSASPTGIVNSSLWAMGDNSFGQLGDGTNEPRVLPVMIEENDILKVAASGGHTLFLKTDGSLWGMGENTYGQLGDGTWENKNEPILIVASDVVDIAAGGWGHSLFVKSDGSLWGMGANVAGELGDGTYESKNQPVKIEDSGVKEVTGGWYYSAYLKEDGSVWTMGTDYFEGGEGANPKKIVDSGVKKIAAGCYHLILIKENNSLWGMGSNDYGQLGDGTSNHRNQPVEIASGVKDIVAGDSHSLFIKENGSLWGMGANWSGEIGNGSYEPQYVPVMIEQSGVIKIGAEEWWSAYVKEDGSLWAMGSNNYGGGSNDRLVPEKLVESGVSDLALGWGYCLFTKGTAYAEQPLWLTINTDEGTIDPENSSEIQVTADANLLPAETATAYVIIESNDPNQPVTSVTVTATLLDPDSGMILSPGEINFAQTYVGQTSEQELTIVNGGTSAFEITNFVFFNSAFSHHLDIPLVLEGGEQLNTTIYFEPNAAGTFESSALIITNENGQTPYNLPVNGTAVIAPSLTYDPGQISESLRANEEKTFSFNISNNGGSPLEWTLKGATTPCTVASGSQCSTSCNHGVGLQTFKYAKFFQSAHFNPLEKGDIDKREGNPISTMGGGPDFHGYSWTDSNDPAGPVYKWEDIAEDGELLETVSQMDDGWQEVSIPFAMNLYGKEFDSVFVSSNGYLTLGEPSEEHAHFPLPTTMMPGNLIAPLAMDLNPENGGNIYMIKDQEKIMVQYDKVRDFSGLNEYTFQVVLYRNGVIFFHYNEVGDGDKSATTGIQNESKDIGLLVAYNSAQIQSEMSVRVSTSPKWLHVSKASGTVMPGQTETIEITLKSGTILGGNYETTMDLTSNDPEKLLSQIPVNLIVEATRLLTVDPTALNFGEVEVGVSKTKEFTVSNDGNAPVELSNLTTNNDVFSSNLSNVTISPNSSRTFDLTFKPSEAISYQSVSILTSNAENGPHEISLSGVGLATPKLKVIPESVSITVEAGQTGSEMVTMDNTEGLAAGNFQLVEIRSGQSGNSLSKFDETNSKSSEIIPQDIFSAEHVEDELIVIFKTDAEQFENAENFSGNIQVLRNLATARTPGSNTALNVNTMSLIKNTSGLSLREMAAQLALDPSVERVEPNYIVRHTNVPNDPNYSQQWALPKINATGAWEIAKGDKEVVVAVIDTGIDYNHPDLEGNIWINPGEIAGNNIDDDGNGYIDDVYGWDFCNNDNDPMDGDGHGTHVGGTIAAATNNGELVAGVAWHASLVGLKFLSDDGWGSTADAIDAVAYCAAMNFPISNNSWGGGGYSQALKDVIAETAAQGHLFCAAAGNSSSNNDEAPHYPSNYDLPSIISVAASDSADELAWFSCYGAQTVDMAAPGAGILSLIPGGGTASYSGTSMATPHVAGAAALVLSINPEFGHQEIKNVLMNSIDHIPAFEGKMVAAGRLNLAKAMEASSPSWLSISPDSGTVSAGAQSSLTFTADATNFNAGTKNAVAVFETNDPLADVFEVPVTLTITGEPTIVVNPTEVDFGSLWVGDLATREIEVINVGTDTLTINSMDFSSVVFSTESSDLSLLPGQSKSIALDAKPQSSGNTYGTLTINSNDQANTSVVVSLSVDAVLPPSLTFSPEIISLTLERGTNDTRDVSISNTGEAQGIWNAFFVETTESQINNANIANVIESLKSRTRTSEISSPRLLTLTGPAAALANAQNPVIRVESNEESDLEIAVLGSAFDYENEDIVNGLVSTNLFGAVTAVNVSTVTPTVGELAAFDAVLVYTIDPYMDAEILGNNLAEYANGGGGVVTASFEQDYGYLEGEWRDQKLGLFDEAQEGEGSYVDSENSLGASFIQGHPIFKNVETFSSKSFADPNTPDQGSVVIANWETGAPLITTSTSGPKRAFVSFIPVSDQADQALWGLGWHSSTDGWNLIANTILWTTFDSNPEWISSDTLDGVVNGGEISQMQLVLDAAELEEGNYSAEVHFMSNDPVNSFSMVEVRLTVRENQPPVAISSTVTLMEDQSINFELEASDPDGDQLSYEIISSAQFGDITGNAPNLNYIPEANFNGQDTLLFRVSDGSLESEIAEVTFNVLPVNDAPWAGSEEINSTEDEFFVVEFKYGDSDSEEIEFNLTKLPENGFLWEQGGMLLYFPNNHYNGEDEIRFNVSDGELISDEATIKINLEPQNDAPVAEELVFQTQQNQTVVITLEAVDVDGDSVTFDLETLPEHGILSQVNTSTWYYTPNEQFTGTDTLFYRANDSKIQSDLAKVSINVNNENNAPVVQNSTFSMQEDGSLQIKLEASDPEGDALNFSIVNGPSNGTLSGNGPDYEYAPDANFNGTDQFTVVANDGMLESNIATISMLITSQNDAPTFVKSINTMSSGLRETPYRIEVEVEDVDNDELSLTVAKDPENGICYFENEKLVYLPNPGFEGIDNIELELSDGTEVVSGNFPVSIVSHSNPIYLNSDLEVHPELLDMLYQANEILFANADRTLELSTENNANSLTAEFTNQLLEDPIELTDWLEQIKSEVNEGKFIFAASETASGLRWEVAPLLDPAFSVDTDMDNKGSSAANENAEINDAGNSASDIEGISRNGRDSLFSGNISEESNQDLSSDSSLIEESNNEVFDNPLSDVGQDSEYITSSFITEIGSGWYQAPGIGTFYDAGNGWIYEPSMGWSFLKVCSSDCSAWLFNENLGWLWFSTDLPNMTFSNNEGVANWIYYPGNTLGQSDLVFDYAQSSWMQWK